jgi:uncharacterized protein (DUF58 family)
MRKVGQIRLLTVRLVDEQFSGDYHSSFKGQGIEFDEVRTYVPGDDVRAIDWNVTARTGYPHVKRYAEERELTVLFLVDVSGSQVFGSGTRTKTELSALITCILAMAAARNEDRIGLIDFSDRIVKTIPPRKGRTAVMRLVREVLAGMETRHGTDIAGALRFLNNVQKRRALVILVSDFQGRDFDAELRTAAVHHDLVALCVADPRERELPNVGLVEIEDPETGERLLVDTASRAVREHVARSAREEEAARLQSFRRYGVDAASFLTTDPDERVVHTLRQLFRRRELRAGRRG